MGVKQTERFRPLITACVVYYRQGQPVCFRGVQCGDDLGNIVGRGDKVEIVRTFFLQLQKNFGKAGERDLLSEVIMADLTVLTINAL